jgi:hypothetical protein
MKKDNGMLDKIYVLYSASYMDWKPVGKFKSLEELKKQCIVNYGFPEEILEDDEEFDECLDGYEMKFEII